jgi:hypothetical protein
MGHHSCLILLLIGLLCCRYNTADAADTLSCTCSCCYGRDCTATTVDSFTVTSCNSGDCSENICRTRFPSQCPAEGQNGAIISRCRGSGGGNGSATNVKVAAFGVYVVLMSVVATVNFLF